MLAIIIVTYNNRKDLDDCLLSVMRSTFSDYRLIIVDNNSSDGTVDYLKKVYPTVDLIETGSNLGFTGGNNVGISRALEYGCKYIMLLNPDTIVDSNTLKSLASHASEKIILQPLILLHRNGRKTDFINTAGNNLNFLGFSYCGHYLDKVSNLTENREIIIASGACSVYPAALFKNIGAFDDSFFMYHEDVDLSWRARMCGYKIILTPAAKIWHKYSFSRNKRKFFFSERNRLLFVLKSYQLRTILLLLPIGLFTEALMIVYSLLNGWLIEKLRSYLSIMLRARALMRERSQVQKQRTLFDNELKNNFSDTLYFQEVNIPGVKVVNAIFSKYWAIVKSLV